MRARSSPAPPSEEPLDMVAHEDDDADEHHEDEADIENQVEPVAPVPIPDTGGRRYGKRDNTRSAQRREDAKANSSEPQDSVADFSRDFVVVVARWRFWRLRNHPRRQDYLAPSTDVEAEVQAAQ